VPDEPVDFWAILKTLIGKDITKVSLPVILNEPLCALQRFAECFTGAHEQFEQAATCDDPIKRMALVVAGIVSAN